jgi:hypothetical protein
MIQFISILNFIDMTLAKLIDMMEKKVSTAFHYFVESQLIQVRNLKKHKTQFVLILNLIYVKLTKVIEMSKTRMNREE